MLGAMILLDAARAFIDANQAVIGLILFGLMFIGFVIERFPATVVAIMGSCAFLFLGILDAEGLFSVFSNPAPITIGAMFILSGAMLLTGIIAAIADLIINLAKEHARLATAELFLGVLVRSEEHTSELKSLMRTSYAVFFLKKKNTS